MALTISHASALRITRLLRSEGVNLAQMDHTALAHPAPWTRNRWSKREFQPETWNWQQPDPRCKLDILVSSPDERLRIKHVRNHICSANLPDGSILWLDEHTSMPSPALLFVQIAETASLPALVLLGHELCGNYTRCAHNPAEGPIIDNISAATSVAEIRAFLNSVTGVTGMNQAKAALDLIADHTLSAPEAILSTMYSLPPRESGYGMGPVALNRRIALTVESNQTNAAARYPDILFSFAPIGLNYDGEGHLDLVGLADAARQAALADADAKAQAEHALTAKLITVREKAVDDIQRNRQLAAEGFIVFPVVKEDLYEWGALDTLTRQILACAREVFGVDTSAFEETLENTELARDRPALLNAMLPGQPQRGASEII